MTAETDLLPLPERFSFMEWETHMRDYARACVSSATAAKDAEIEALRAEVERLRRELAEFEGFERAQHEAFSQAEAACRKAIDGIKGDSND